MDSTASRRGRGLRLWTGVRWGVALLLAAFTAWLSIRQVDWTSLRAVLERARLPLLALALGTVLVTNGAKAARWRVLLRSCDAGVSGWRVLRVVFLGQMLNSFLPRLGDVGRAVLVGPQARGGVPATLGTILVEKALDGVMGLLVLVALALWTPLPGWLRGPVLALALLTGGLLLLLLLAAAQRKGALRLYRRMTGWLPSEGQLLARRLLPDFGRGLGLLRQPANALQAMAWTVTVWLLSATTNVATLAALGIETPAWTIWLVLVAGYVATFLPTVPAQIGVFEYACVLALEAAGIEPEPALAFGLVLHLLVYLPPAILGPIGMAVEGLSWTGLKRAQHEYLEHKRVPS